MRRMFYGWWIVAVAFLTHCVTVGLVFYSFGVFLPTLTAYFGWSRAEVSLGFSLVSLCAAVYSPLVGRLVDRFGPRPLQLFGAAVVALGFLLVSRMRTLTEFYVLMGAVLALGAASMGNLPSNAAVTNWFVRLRGRALGIATMGISVGGVIFVPLSQFLIARYGWREAFVLLGLIVILVVVPPVALLMRRSPESMGLQPDGGSSDRHEARLPHAAGGEVSWTAAQAVRHRNFWLIVAAFALTITGLSATLLHQITFFGDRGMPLSWASWVASGTACFGALGKLGFGTLCGRLGFRRVTILCFVLQCVGLVFLIAPMLWWTLILYMVIYGFSMGGTTTLQATIVGVCFGRLHYGSIAGRIAPFMSVTQALVVPLTGYVRDSSGSYIPAFLAIIAANILGIVCISKVDVRAKPPEVL